MWKQNINCHKSHTLYVDLVYPILTAKTSSEADHIAQYALNHFENNNGSQWIDRTFVEYAKSNIDFMVISRL